MRGQGGILTVFSRPPLLCAMAAKLDSLFALMPRLSSCVCVEGEGARVQVKSGGSQSRDG